MIINILVFGSNNFNKSLEEIKNKLSLNLIIYDAKDYIKQTIHDYHVLLVDNEFLEKKTEVDLIKLESFKLPILLLIDSQAEVKKKIYI